jgi:hypothetical protein
MAKRLLAENSVMADYVFGLGIVGHQSLPLGPAANPSTTSAPQTLYVARRQGGGALI